MNQTSLWRVAKIVDCSRAMMLAAVTLLLLNLHAGSQAEEVDTGDGGAIPQVNSSARADDDRPDKPVHTEDWQRWFPGEQCWFDLKKKIVIVDGQICQREALLEMFACPARTKDHESIVSVNCRAATIHAYLLAVGAQSGSPVRYEPKYAAASGTEIEIFVYWTDENGKSHSRKAQELVRHFKTGETLQHPWVFAGSEIWQDEDGQEHYLAESGDLICVSNFRTATLDVPVKSSQANEELLYEPFTERIPPRDTKVRLVLRPCQTDACNEDER